MEIQNLVGNSLPSGNTAQGVKNTAASRSVPNQVNTPGPEPSLEDLKKTVGSINKSFQKINTNIQFRIDISSLPVTVKMVDPSTGDVISQYPTTGAIAIDQAMNKEMKLGVLLNQKA